MELSNPQPPTPLNTENYTASIIFNNIGGRKEEEETVRYIYSVGARGGCRNRA